MQTVKLLALGGCHIAGHGLKNQEDCFINAATTLLRKDGVEFIIKIIPNFLYKNSSAFIDAIKEFEPKIVLLQMGNYEFTPGLSRELKKVLRQKKIISTPKRTTSVASLSDSPGFVGRDNVPLIEYYMTRLTDPFKELINLFFPFSKRHSARFYSDIEVFIETMKKQSVEIIYLSALPTLGPFINRRRRLFNDKYFELCKHPNIKLIDTFSIIPRKPAYFQDSIHLGPKGHKCLADHLYPILKLHLSSSSTTVQVPIEQTVQ